MAAGKFHAPDQSFNPRYARQIQLFDELLDPCTFNPRYAGQI